MGLKKIPEVPGHWCSAPKIIPWVPQQECRRSLCQVSLGLSLLWWLCPPCQDVPRAWHSRVGTLLLWWVLLSPAPPCVLQEYIPDLQLEGLCMSRVGIFGNCVLLGISSFSAPR